MSDSRSLTLSSHLPQSQCLALGLHCFGVFLFYGARALQDWQEWDHRLSWLDRESPLLDLCNGGVRVRPLVERT